MKKNYKKYIVIAVKMAIAVGAITYLFKGGWLSGKSITNLFKAENVPYIVLSGALFVAAQIMCSLRLKTLMRAINYPLSLMSAFKLTMIGNFFNMVIPGMVGGDVVKGYFLARDEGDGRGKSTGIIIMDRMLGVVSIAFVGITAIGYLAFQQNAILSQYNHEMRIVIYAIGSLMVLSLAILIFGKHLYGNEWIKRVAGKVLRGGYLYQLIDGFGSLLKRRTIILWAFLISITVQVLALSGLLILAHTMDSAVVDPIGLVAVAAVVILIGIVPVTPGNIGWTELVAAFGWNMIGSHSGAAIFLYWRIVTVLCSLSGGLLYLAYSSKPRGSSHVNMGQFEDSASQVQEGV